MNRKALLWLGGGFVALGLLLSKVVPRLRRGRKLTSSEVDASGYVNPAPASLAASAGLPLDLYTIARVMSSEWGPAREAEKIAIGWVVKNEARHRGVSVTELVVKNGLYGKQVQGRFVGSSIDPYEDDLAAARKVLGSTYDPTGGAVRFFHPSGVKDPVALRDKRIHEGFSPVSVAGTRSDEIWLFRRA